MKNVLEFNLRRNKLELDQRPNGDGMPLEVAMLKEEIEDLTSSMRRLYDARIIEQQEGIYVHTLHMDRDLLDFIRLALSIKKIDPDMVLIIKNNTDHMVSEMANTFEPQLKN